MNKKKIGVYLRLRRKVVGENIINSERANNPIGTMPVPSICVRKRKSANKI